MTAAATLCRILDQWSLEGGDLPVLLKEYRDFAIHTEIEVRSLCGALDALHNAPRNHEVSPTTPLATLTQFFSRVANEEAKVAVLQEGLTVLRWFVADAVAGKEFNDDDILQILELFATHQQKEDVEWIYKAILKPIAPKSRKWFSILSHFHKGASYSKPLIQGLAKHLPRETACLAFLNLCNQAYEEGWVRPHGFQSEIGLARLAKYLHPDSQRPVEYAQAAADALKYLAPEFRGELQQLASRHHDPIVSLQMVLERALSGSESDAHLLKERCQDVRVSFLTQESIKRSGMESLIPTEARDPKFLILAEMAYWLATSSDYQCPPDSLQLIDSRTLFWPSDHQNKTLHLVQYEYNNPPGGLPPQGIGMVGSRVYSLVGETQVGMSPEDVYGLHCCWEMEQAGDPLAPRNRIVKTGRNILRRSNPGF